MSFSLFRTVYASRFPPFDSIPGPEPTFPLGTAGDFMTARPWEPCARYATEYGPVTRIWLGGNPGLVLNDPDLIGEVLVDRPNDFYKEAPVAALRPVITPSSLFISNPPQWQAARSANPLGAIDQEVWLAGLIDSLRPVLMNGLNRLVEKSRSGPVDLFWEMQRLTFDVFSQAFWGEVLPPDRFDWFQTMARTGSRRMKAPVLLTPPLDPRFYLARSNWYKTFEDLVAQARRSPRAEGTDLLSLFLRQGSGMSDAAIAEGVATGFFGGVFSGSSTLNSTLYLLSQHPAERDRLRAAVAELPEGAGLAALRGCDRLEFVLREAMRCLPAVPLYFRNSAVDRTVRLGKWQLPPRTTLMISNWWIHRQSPHWRNPESFLPDRWDHGVAEEHPYGSGYFFPFGRGPRMCIGMPFARCFLQLALSQLLGRFEVELVGNSGYSPTFFFGVLMPEGLRARLTARAR